MTSLGLCGPRSDPWLEGWLNAFPQLALRPTGDVRVLDVNFDGGRREYRETLETWHPSPMLCQRSAVDRMRGEFDVVSVIAVGGPSSFSPMEPDDPFAYATTVSRAARLLAPGGVILMSFIYCFDENHRQLRSAVEPAAFFNNLLWRGLWPIASPLDIGASRISMHHDPDTLFIGQNATLRLGEQHMRATRVFMAMARPGPRIRLAVRSEEAAHV